MKRLKPLASDGRGQSELFATYRYHAFITNNTPGIVQAIQRHRDHALVDQSRSSPSSRTARRPPTIGEVRLVGHARGDRVEDRPRHRRFRVDAHRSISRPG